MRTARRSTDFSIDIKRDNVFIANVDQAIELLRHRARRWDVLRLRAPREDDLTDSLSLAVGLDRGRQQPSPSAFTAVGDARGVRSGRTDDASGRLAARRLRRDRIYRNNSLIYDARRRTRVSSVDIRRPGSCTYEVTRLTMNSRSAGVKVSATARTSGRCRRSSSGSRRRLQRRAARRSSTPSPGSASVSRRTCTSSGRTSTSTNRVRRERDLPTTT